MYCSRNRHRSKPKIRQLVKDHRHDKMNANTCNRATSTYPRDSLITSKHSIALRNNKEIQRWKNYVNIGSCIIRDFGILAYEAVNASDEEHWESETQIKYRAQKDLSVSIDCTQP